MLALSPKTADAETEGMCELLWTTPSFLLASSKGWAWIGFENGALAVVVVVVSSSVVPRDAGILSDDDMMTASSCWWLVDSGLVGCGTRLAGSNSKDLSGFYVGAVHTVRVVHTYPLQRTGRQIVPFKRFCDIRCVLLASIVVRTPTWSTW